MPVSPIDNALRAALGQGVDPIAQYFDVYRLTGASTGQWIAAPNKVITNYKARITFKPPTTLVEQVALYKMLYVGMCDTRRLQVGDVLVLKGPVLTGNDNRMYILTDVQPMMPPVFVRCEVPGAISRPHGPGTMTEPLLGDGGLTNTTKSTEWLLTLSAGAFDMTSTGPACTVPIGIAARERGAGHQENKYPTASPRGEYDVYVPELPGFQVQPNDIVSDAFGNRFRLTVVTNYDVGIRGYQCRAETLFV